MEQDFPGPRHAGGPGRGGPGGQAVPGNVHRAEAAAPFGAGADREPGHPVSGRTHGRSGHRGAPLPPRMHPRTEGQGKDRPAVQPRYGRGGEPVRRHCHSPGWPDRFCGHSRGTGGPPGHLLQRPDQNKPGTGGI